MYLSVSGDYATMHCSKVVVFFFQKKTTTKTKYIWIVLYFIWRFIYLFLSMLTFSLFSPKGIRDFFLNKFQLLLSILLREENMEWNGKTSRNNINLISMIITVLGSIAQFDRVLSTRIRAECFFFFSFKTLEWNAVSFNVIHVCLLLYPSSSPIPPSLSFSLCVCGCVSLFQHQRKSLFALFRIFFHLAHGNPW